RHTRSKRDWSSDVCSSDLFRRGDETVPLARRFWELLAPHRTVMAQAFVGALVFTLLGLATSIYVQKIVDYVLIDGNRNLLNLMRSEERRVGKECRVRGEQD